MRQKINSILSFVKKQHAYFVLCTLYVVLSSCGKSDPNSPGIEYMPDMYRSPSHEANLSTTFEGKEIQSNRMPVAGTIARGYMPYIYGNDTAGYANAGRYLKNPVAYSEAVLAEGEVLYIKYCTHCHGASGAGDGLVAAKLPGPPPAYSSGALVDLPEGKIFHSITYGKGMMGSHASQLTQEERWKVVHFVQKLQGKKAGAAQQVAAPVDTTAAASVK